MTTIITIAKATPVTITTTCGITAESTSKGVPGQFDKLVGLINKLPEGEFFIEAEKIKGIFKALKECSKDCTTFSFVLACNEWGLEPKDDNSWVIVRPQGNVTLVNGTYTETTQPKEVEMNNTEFNFKSLSLADQSDMNCLLLTIGGKTFPQSLNDIEDSIFKSSWKEDEKTQQAIQELEDIVRQYRPSQIKEKVKTYPVIVYTGEPKLPTSIQLWVVYSEVSIETDQGVKTSKFLYTNTGIITCKGTKFESVEALINAVKAAFKTETTTVSEVTQTQPEEVAMEQSKPKTFCQLLKDEWLPSRETWVIDILKRKMRTTWKARKEITCERQGKFMAEFFRRLDVYSPNTELPLQAFLTTYNLVKEDMTGQKTQAEVPVELKPIQKDHNIEEVKDAYTSHLNNLLNKFPDRSVEAVTQPSITPVENLEEEFQLTSPEELPERVVVHEKDVYLDEGVCKAIRQACMQLMAENLKGGNEFYKGKYTGSYTVYEPEFWLAKAHQQLHGYCFENYVEEKDTGDLTVEIVRESYRTTPAGDTARAFLGTLGLVSEEVALDWNICINTPNADEEVGDCFEFGLVW